MFGIFSKRLKRSVPGCELSPYKDIEVLVNREPIEDSFADYWLFEGPPTFSVFVDNRIFDSRCKTVTVEDVTKLLGDKDHRLKSTAAIYAAVKQYSGLENEFGRFLLKNDLGAGKAIIFYLTSIGSTKYIADYLNYYLGVEERYLQLEAMAAICYLLSDSSSEVLPSLLSRWSTYIGDDAHWSLESRVQAVSECMNDLMQYRKLIQSAG